MDSCQRIMCSVGICVHNKKDDNFCTLGAVQVSAAAKSDSGAPYDETLCASYKNQHAKVCQGDGIIDTLRPSDILTIQFLFKKLYDFPRSKSKNTCFFI